METPRAATAALAEAMMIKFFCFALSIALLHEGKICGIFPFPAPNRIEQLPHRSLPLTSERATRCSDKYFLGFQQLDIKFSCFYRRLWFFVFFKRKTQTLHHRKTRRWGRQRGSEKIESKNRYFPLYNEGTRGKYNEKRPRSRLPLLASNRKCGGSRGCCIGLKEMR
jgi:hypothetical protein